MKKHLLKGCPLNLFTNYGAYLRSSSILLRSATSGNGPHFLQRSLATRSSSCRLAIQASGDAKYAVIRNTLQLDVVYALRWEAPEEEAKDNSLIAIERRSAGELRQRGAAPAILFKACCPLLAVWCSPFDAAARRAIRKRPQGRPYNESCTLLGRRLVGKFSSNAGLKTQNLDCVRPKHADRD